MRPASLAFASAGLLAAALCLAIAPPFAWAAPEKVVLKLGTVAPEGTRAVTTMGELNAAVKAATGGAVEFKVYTGAVLGDEPAMLEKMEAGQLHAAGFTGVGLGRVLSEVRVLEAPFLFRDNGEQDFVVERLTPHFEARLAEKGYVLLGWAEVGWIYIFSKRPVRSAADLAAAKVWVWEGDPLAAATFERFEVKPTPLALTDVLPMLDTGLVDTVYTSPYYCLGLQWHPKLATMTDLPIVNATGAVLCRQDRFEAIPEEARARVLALCREHFRKLVLASRDEARESIEALQDEGIEVLTPAPADADTFRQGGAEVADRLAGTLYPPELLQRVRALIAEYRAAAK